jgi:hypothetical protein
MRLSAVRSQVRACPRIRVSARMHATARQTEGLPSNRGRWAVIARSSFIAVRVLIGLAPIAVHGQKTGGRDLRALEAAP